MLNNLNGRELELNKFLKWSGLEIQENERKNLPLKVKREKK
jgi:hypothetical protein